MQEDIFNKNNVQKALESFTDWGNIGIQFVVQNYGDKVAIEYLKSCGHALVSPIIEDSKGNGLKILKGIELFHRLMGSKVNIIEDENKCQLVILDCASGDRMKRKGLITQRMKDNTPYYCFHCTLWWQDMLRAAGFNYNFKYSEKGPCIYEYIKNNS